LNADKVTLFPNPTLELVNMENGNNLSFEIKALTINPEKFYPLQPNF